MQTATVEVKYVNPPKSGKQYGSIKDADNNIWPVKKDRIGDFEPNNQYELAYTEADNGFKNIIGVKLVQPEPVLPRGEFAKIEPQGRNGATLMARSAQQPAPQTKPQANANGYYRPTAPRDSERMFVCAIAGHWIDTGRLDMTEEAMIGLVNSLRNVYAATFGADDTAG